MTMLYDEFDWGPTREAHEAFWARELDRPILLIAGRRKDAPATRHQERYIPAFGDRSLDEIVAITEENLRATWYARDGHPFVFANFGAGSVAAYVGLARAECTEHGGVWFHPAGEGAIEDVSIRARFDTDWFERSDAYTRAIVERVGEKTQITLPDLGGMLDILASVRTTETLLMDLVDNPDEVERLINETLAAWWTYYDHFHAITSAGCPGTRSWAPVWSSRRTYMFQSDFSYMISPDMFAQFVVPELTECCRRVDHGFYHMDGLGQLAHLDLLLGIEPLRGIQWVPGEGKKNPCQWPDVFQRIQEAGKLIQTWALTPDEVFDVVEFTNGARGIIFEVRGLEQADADAYVAAVERACRSARGRLAR
jgi:hypothetical protein